MDDTAALAYGPSLFGSSRDGRSISPACLQTHSECLSSFGTAASESLDHCHHQGAIILTTTTSPSAALFPDIDQRDCGFEEVSTVISLLYQQAVGLCRAMPARVRPGRVGVSGMRYRLPRGPQRAGLARDGV